MVRLVAEDFPAFPEFTYGKRVNKTSKGTEKPTDLLQTYSAKSRWNKEPPIGVALFSYLNSEHLQISTAKRQTPKATKV
ncbi:MAG TPA: hypothetical protein VN284_02935 [Rhizobium sp.]|nr:hypothetical protein [Rhizobium sp.]